MLQVDKDFDQTGRSAPTRLSGAVFIGLGTLTVVGALLSPSPLVMLACGIVLIFILVLLWEPGQHPILLVPTLLQFSEVALKPITTAITGTSLQDLADFGASLEPAALFGLAGLTALVIGQRIGAGASPSLAREAEILDWPFRRILGLGLAAIVVGHIIEMFAIGGVRQIVLALSGLKWAGLFVLAYSMLRLRRGLRWLAAIVAVELALGMSGFFSEFRLVLFVLIGATMTAHRIMRRGMAMLVFGAVMTVLLAVFWSAVKEDYRAFLNEGTGAQVVLRPLDERLAYLAEQTAEFDAQKLANGFELLFKRLSYIDFLAATMERVPKELPHEGGAHLAQAIMHILTPRILFPDKPVVPSDTQVTAYYTGLATAIFSDENTSLSIGYLGELYIDFGVGGALLAAFLMGFVSGRCYRAIRDYPRTPAFVNYGLCMMLALGFTSFGTALIKLCGGLMTILIAVLVLQRLILPALLSSGYVGASVGRGFGRGTKA